MRKFWLSSFVSLNLGKNLSNVVELPKRMVTQVTISLGYITDQIQDFMSMRLKLTARPEK